MARTKNNEQQKVFPDRGGDNEHRRGGEGNRRKSKRNTTASGAPINKKSKATTQGIDEQVKKNDTETPTNRKQNDGDDDNANKQSGAMDDRVTEEGISTENEFVDDNAKAQHGESTVEGGQIRTNDSQSVESKTLAVRKSSFSNLEKHDISSNTNISAIFVDTRALYLQETSSSHKAVVNKRRVVPFILQTR